jgi:hypothetical protein
MWALEYLTTPSSPSSAATGTGVEVDLSARTIALPYGPLQVAVDPSGFKFGDYRLEKFVPKSRRRMSARGDKAPRILEILRSRVNLCQCLGVVLRRAHSTRVEPCTTRAVTQMRAA